MKISNINKDLPATADELLMKAMDLERVGELAGAAEVYAKLVKASPVNEKVYHRLMILYRKLKDPTKELHTINVGISAFENLYKCSVSYDKKVIQLSRALQKATGLADKKGNNIYEPEPLGRWKKRKKVVEKLLKKM
jgi:hypothetical protein